MPDLVLHQVEVQAGSLGEAWGRLSSRHLVRSVLVRAGLPSETRPVNLQMDGATFDEVLAAFLAVYDEHQLSVDPHTGVMWIHPKMHPYETILPQRFAVSRDYYQLPMESGVLSMLAQADSSRKLRAQVAGPTGFRNTHNYPVDIPRGNWTAREVINFACASSPSKTFYVDLAPHGLELITPYNISSSGSQHAREGSILFWRLEGTPMAGDEPSYRELVEALSSPDPRVRWASRNYVNAEMEMLSFQALLDVAAPGAESVWTALALSGIVARVPGATYSAAIVRLRLELVRDDQTAPSKAMRALAALDGFRLTNDEWWLAQLPREELGENEEQAIILDVARLLKLPNAMRHFVSNNEHHLRAMGILPARFVTDVARIFTETEPLSDGLPD